MVNIVHTDTQHLLLLHLCRYIFFYAVASTSMFQVSLDMAEETKMKESTATLLATSTAAGNLSALGAGKSGGEKKYGMTVLAIATIIVLVFILFGGVSWIVHLSHRCADRCASASPPSATISHSSSRSDNSSGDQSDGGSGGGGSGSGGGGGTGGTKGLQAKRQESYVEHLRRVDVTVGGLLLKGYKKDRIFFWYDSCRIPASFIPCLVIHSPLSSPSPRVFSNLPLLLPSPPHLQDPSSSSNILPRLGRGHSPRGATGAGGDTHGGTPPVAGGPDRWTPLQCAV